MWKKTSMFFTLAAMAVMLSLSVSASDIGYKNDTVSYIVASSGFEELAELAVIATDSDVPFMGTTMQSLEKLKPKQQEKSISYHYPVLKPTSLAKMQNQNFDRVMVSVTY